MNSFINVSIIVLFLTNIWVFLYMKSLDYLNFRYPAKLTEVFFTSRLSVPEPFEIILYVGATLLFVFLIVLFSQEKIQQWYEGSLKRIGKSKYLIFVFLLILFVSKLGTFPLAGDLSSYPASENKEIYLFTFLLILGFVLFFLIETYLVQKIITNKTVQAVTSFVLLTIIIVVSLFTPRFPISIPDLSFFYGPIYEIASGKTIFTDIRSDYGFLSIIFFTAIHLTTHLKFEYLPYFLLFFDFCQYLICFYLIYETSRSYVFSFIGIFSILIVNYFASTFGPQASAIRWLPLFLVMFLVYKLRKIDHFFLLFLLPFFSLWSIDSGLQLMLGYIFTLFLLLLAKKITLQKLLITVGLLMLSFGFTVFMIQAGHILFGYQPVDFLKMYHSVRKYAVTGLSMVPMPPYTYFWLFMLVYFTSILYFFKSNKQTLDARNLKLDNEVRSSKIEVNQASSFKHQNPDSRLQLPASVILLSSNLMFFVSMYYVGRSMPHELFSTGIFFIFTTFLLAGRIYSGASPYVKLVILLLLFIIFIAFPLDKRIEYVTAKILNKYQMFAKGQIYTPEIPELVQNLYREEIPFIKKNISEDQVIIFSPDESYLFYFIKKKNILNENPISRGVQMESEIAPALRDAVKICPKKIVADCELYNRCPVYEKLTYDDQITFPFLLTELEKQCRITYSPTNCTNKLCIVEAK